MSDHRLSCDRIDLKPNRRSDIFFFFSSVKMGDSSKKEKVEKEDGKKKRKREKKESRDERKQQRKELMKKVPKVDEHGIKYTKIELRRMRKRVARGLDPIETEEEARERMRNEKQLQREEEAELSGMVYRKEQNDNDKQLDDQEQEQTLEPVAEKEQSNDKPEQEESPAKKKKRSKPVPGDYVCQACKKPGDHWIYDCPQKVRMPGTNQVSKRNRGLNAPDSRKVFLSGLPFEAKYKDVTGLLASCGKVVHCKLLKFPDTGRCKGQALVAFETEEQAKTALTLSGTMIDSLGDKKEPLKRPLKLSVSKVKSRAETKRTQ